MKNDNKKKENHEKKKIILLLLFGIISLFSFQMIVSAINIDSCQNLTSANSIYELNQSIINNGLLGNCIQVSAINITIDCKGFFISSINNVSGIFSVFANTTVKNCNITMGGGTVINNNAVGVYIDVSGGTLFNNTIFVSNGYGSRLANPFKNVTNNIIRSNLSVGLLMSTSSNGFVFNNNISSSSNIGYHLLNSNNNRLNFNVITSNSNYALFVQNSDNNTIFNLDSRGFSSGSFGIGFSGNADNNVIKDSINISGFNKDVVITATSINDTFLNCSYNITKEQVDSGSQLFRKWYYRGYVNTSSGNSISNASISLIDKFGFLNTLLLTNSSGFTSIYEILDYQNLGNSYNYSSNYTMIANFSLNSLQKSENITFLKNNVLDVFTFSDSPLITFISQISPDINSFNLFGVVLNITYNITSNAGVNQSSITMFYKTNSSTSEVNYFTNGTATIGFQNKTFNQNNSDIYSFFIFDNQVYPAIYNINETLMENTPHNLQSLTSASDYASIELLNVSNSSQYSFLEIMANRTTGVQALRFYYCNSSYIFGVSNAPDINSNCINFYSDIDGNYNHTHTQYSSHKVILFPINVTTGTIQGIKITSSSYFMIRGATNWQYYYINNTARINATRTTSNNGVSWSSQNFTIDSHLHQFSGNNSLWYYVCANDNSNYSSCSSLRQDLLDLLGIPPTAPNVYSPISTYYRNNLSINYTASVSLNSYAVNYYNITLLNLNLSFNKTITINNSNNLGFIFNTINTTDGFYIIKVTACDNQSQCSSGFSSFFGIDNSPPFGDLIFPANNSIFFTNTINFTINVSDNSSLSNLTLNIRYPNGTLINQETISINGTQGLFGIVYTFLTNGFFEWFYTIYDVAGNFFQTISRFLFVSSVPSVSILYPINDTNYNFSITHFDYSISNGDSCWYSLNNGLVNISTICGTSSITGLISNNGINIWNVYANNTFGNESSAQVIFNSTCMNFDPLVIVDSYPYVDFNSTYHISLSSFPIGISHIQLELIDPNNTISFYDFVYDNVSSYDLTLTFLQEGDYGFIIFGDNICPSILNNITGVLRVLQPFYITIEGFKDKETTLFTSNKYKNDFSYVTAEITSQNKLKPFGYNTQLETFLTPLLFKYTQKTPVFHAPYLDGIATLKLYEKNQTYALRLFDGQVTFNSTFSVPNITKSYGTNIYIGQETFNGTNEDLKVLLKDKDIRPYFWLFNIIVIIIIIMTILISLFLFFMIPTYPFISIGFFIILTVGTIVGRIIVFFVLG